MRSTNVVIASPETSDRESARACLEGAADYMRSRSKPGVTFICQERLSCFAGDKLEEVIATSGLQKGPVYVEMVGDAAAIVITATRHSDSVASSTRPACVSSPTSQARPEVFPCKQDGMASCRRSTCIPPPIPLSPTEATSRFRSAPTSPLAANCISRGLELAWENGRRAAPPPSSGTRCDRPILRPESYPLIFTRRKPEYLSMAGWDTGHAWSFAVSTWLPERARYLRQ
jgi:hypothetical protein